MALFLTKDLDDPARSRLGVWQITETEEELKAITSVPSDELEEISYIKNESLRKQKYAVRALLDAMFEEKVYLSHHDNGKPYIVTLPMESSMLSKSSAPAKSSLACTNIKRCHQSSGASFTKVCSMD